MGSASPGVDRAASAGASATANASSGAPSAAGLEPAASAGDFVEAARFLPQGRIGDWQQSGAVIRSNAANLAQLIDGAAVSYEQYNVRHYAKTEYRRAGTHLVALVEVYTFESPLGAFGRYSLNVSDGRDPSTLRPQAVNIGAGGYQGTSQLTFWKGAQLVQVSVSDDSDDPDEAAMNAAARDALPLVANAVARTITEEGVRPASPLPQAGLVWGGETYRGEGVLGAEQTGPGWVGYYAQGEGAAARRYRLAVLARADVAAAQQTLGRLRHNAGTAVPGLGDEAFEVGTGSEAMLVARAGTRVLAVADGGAAGLTGLDAAGRRDVLRAAIASTAAAMSAGH